MNMETTCPSCHSLFVLKSSKADLPPHYCPFCGTRLASASNNSEDIKPKEEPSPSGKPDISILPGQKPDNDKIIKTIGPYQLIHSIGKGGMGEVFLAYDTTCGRLLALKKIRPDLSQHRHLHRRFLKEAHITSQLTHPAIIPIYAIHNEGDLTYYTMPYVEGKTLKQILKEAREQKNQSLESDPLVHSIPALLRHFLSICQAVAYAHSKQVLHRDLKPENIIVGRYGEIVILDWGLAQILKQAPGDEEGKDEETPPIEPIHPQLTHIGKVVGTVAYMAPERAQGHAANFQTDIYALGVILYQLLTLKHPFQRHSLKQFRREMLKEKVLDPIEVAPYRDVPRSLTRVVFKCLSAASEMRYQSVDDLIYDLENYIEGRSEWFQMAELDIHNKQLWEFQENVLMAEHTALTRETETSGWVSLMISKASFQENIKVQAKVKIGQRGQGLGFLLCVPEASERSHLIDGYCLWLGSDLNKSTKLRRSTVEVLSAPDVVLERNSFHLIEIEKIANSLHFYLNGQRQFSYISHLPLTGTHVGLLSKDADFTLEEFVVYVGSQNVTVNCLAVPDAFLAHKDFVTALSEYRRIGYSFPGRAEGREAMFRAGITLLEQANNAGDPEKKSQLYDLAHDEFHKLYNTPGAPLEYLGKALIYQALGEYEEEVKCFELAYLRYPNHPLLPVLAEQIVYRMHDSSRSSRQAAFRFILLVLRFLPDVATQSHTQKLLHNLDKHWEELPFIEADPALDAMERGQLVAFSLKLAFWLARPHVIIEIISSLLALKAPPLTTLANCWWSLVKMRAWDLALEQYDRIKAGCGDLAAFHTFEKEMAIAYSSKLANAIEKEFPLFFRDDSIPLFHKERLGIFLMQQALDRHESGLVHKLYAEMEKGGLSPKGELCRQAMATWSYLWDKEWKPAEEILQSYPLEFLCQDSSIFHFLYGCWLYVTEGPQIANIHFLGIYEMAYPRSWMLFNYFVKGRQGEIEGWIAKLFLWERRELYRQLALFYRCSQEEEKSLEYSRRLNEEVSP